MRESMGRGEYKKGGLYQVDVDAFDLGAEEKLSPSDRELQETLVETIREHGFIQPVLFRRTSEGRLELIGEKSRLLAAKDAGLKTIPAIYCEGVGCEIKVIVNLLRKDITACQRAEALLQAVAYRYPKEKLAKVVGVKVSDINEYLDLTKLPYDLFEECRENGDFAKAKLLQIARIEDEEEQRRLFQAYKERMKCVRGSTAECSVVFDETNRCLELIEENMSLIHFLKNDPEKYRELLERLDRIINSAKESLSFR
jgi:ParB family transcriptional regulator, chromosome partitioning protein